MTRPLFSAQALSVVLTALGACQSPAPQATQDGLVIRAAPLPGPEATSLLGEPLERLELEHHAELTKNLEAALRAFLDDPLDEEALVWLGRRYGYLMRYREAVDVFSYGLQLFEDSAAVRRHRGHRLITLRRFDDAVRDLVEAGELVVGEPDAPEPDGAPNELGIPRSTHQSNIWYHLGLAHYLRGDFEAALAAYERCLELSRVNDDMLCATTVWLWATLQRLERPEQARAVLEPIHTNLDVIENHAYHDLLLFYRGEYAWERLAPQSDTADVLTATTLYGLGNWLLVEGRREEARRIFERVVAHTHWAAFGHIAAEAELASWGQR